MAKFGLFIYDDEDAIASATPEEIATVQEGHGKFHATHGEAVVAGGRTTPTSQSVSIPSGATPVEGPFLDGNKQAIGGWYVVEADSRDEAVEMAKLLPAPWGGVEVRPLQ